ncbi:YidC/Oxa1 family membrane protein insertase [Allocatelliglobosispora scoriae]|uniref:Membrane protein insertase YidC n=2 Tax=Allocatelliglobosispora scoriae TaxID=643052 RepID=A0A841BU92_9ACTN|nr:YidC/Oxa1 family membrane protein insertase [Allocatelliglobosispora scoriae]
MLRWHDLFDAIGLTGTWLQTNWDWILSIVFLVLTVRAILFPLFVKQIRSQRAMQALQPQLKELQTKHKGDRETLQKEMMELYKREKANPLMGCLPLLLQMPVFLGVFHVIKRLGTGTIDKALYGWTPAQYDSAAAAKLFGVSIGATFRDGGAAAVLCGILGVIMIATTYMTSRQMILKTGWAEDPQQRMMQKLMLYGIPATLIISAVAFPLGLIIYWTTTNLFSMGQQFWVLKKYPPPLANGKKADPKKVDPKKADAKDSVAETEAKVLGPKVGAKPVNPKKGGQKPKVG